MTVSNNMNDGTIGYIQNKWSTISNKWHKINEALYKINDIQNK